jgi:hypothetical protein
MNATMNAIQTKYKGCLFRSRLEARWAVFYDALGIEWRYEYEGFDMWSGRWYLPDFYLPKFRCWIEIKGEVPTNTDLQKAFDLNLETYDEKTGEFQDVYIFYGDIPYPYPERGNAVGHCPPSMLELEELTDDDLDDWPPVWGLCWQQCPLCGGIKIGRINTVCCRECLDKYASAVEKIIKYEWQTPVGEMPFFKEGPDIVNPEFFRSGHRTFMLQTAYEAARSARFEGGKGRRHGTGGITGSA